MQVDTANAPVLPEVSMNLVRPKEPVAAVITRNEVCTASRKAAGFIRHIEFDLSGTPLAGQCQPGQAIGVVPPGDDPKTGKRCQVRLYSLASPAEGEDGSGAIHSTTVKRTIDEDWKDHSLFLGVASNYLADRQVGDAIQVTGPSGRRFLLPTDAGAHDYVLFATGTGIAPFRGFLRELANRGCTSRVTLVMGAPYATDLIYHDELLEAEERYEWFTYLTAISRELQQDGGGRMYVSDRLAASREVLGPMLASERTLVYICGIAGMEVGIFQELARQLTGSDLAQYLQADGAALADVDRWSKRDLNKRVKHTKRVLLEVYD